MAESKPIQGDQLIAADWLTDKIKAGEELLHVLKQTETTIKSINKATTAKLQASKGTSSKDLKEQNALINESTKQRQVLVALEAKQIQIETQLAKAKKAAADFDKKKLMDDEKALKKIEQMNSAYATAQKRLTALKNEYRDLAVAGKGADKYTQDLLKEITLLDTELKEVDASMGVFTREVGNYKNAVKDALSETDAFSAGFSKLDAQSQAVITGLNGIIKQLKGVEAAQDNAAAGSKRLSTALKITGIGLILTALASLASFFNSSREGAKEFDIMMNRVSATIDIALRGLIAYGKGLILTFKALGNEIRGAFSVGQKSADYYAKAAEQSAEATELFAHAFDNAVDNIDKQIDALDRLTDKIYEYEDQINQLQIIQKKAMMDEEDYNEIRNNSNRTLNEINEALEQSIIAREKAARAQKGIADRELEIAQLQIERDFVKTGLMQSEIDLIRQNGVEWFLNSKYTLKASSDSINALKEKYLATLEANDALDDLNRQEAERIMATNQAQITAEIELIRSKKLGADGQIQILKDLVADEKIQLEKREQSFLDLSKAQEEGLAEEIRLLTQYKNIAGDLVLSEAEILDLINEKDQVRLANRLTELRQTKLSEEQYIELSKVILEAQNNEVDREKILKKLQEERIQRQEKILQLERETVIIEQQSVLEEIQNIEEQRQQIYADSNTQILQQNNVFNKQLLAQNQQAADQYELLLKEEYKQRQFLADKQYEIDRTNIENSVTDEFLRNAQLEKLQAQYNANRAKLEQEYTEKSEAFKTKRFQDDIIRENRRTQVIVENLQKTTAAVQEELDRRQQIQNDQRQRELDQIERAIDKQRDLAQRGQDNQLAFEEKQREKALLAQQDAERRAAREKENLQLAEALLNAYNARLQQPNANPSLAAVQALSDVLLFKGLAKGLVQFAAEGNDRVQGPGTRTSDSIPFMLSKDEGVVHAEANMGNPGVVAALNAGTFNDMYMPRHDLSAEVPASGVRQIQVAAMMQKNRDSEIVALLTEIKNLPRDNWNWDEHDNAVQTRIERGMKHVIKHVKSKPKI